MKSKVTLKEIVGTKIVYAVLLVVYYWMWARRDWQEYYEVVQHMVMVFTIVFFALQAVRIHKFSKEEKDELAVRNLHRIDAMGLRAMVLAAVVTAFGCGVGALGGAAAGYVLVGAVLVWTVARFVLFCVMDSKGV